MYLVDILGDVDITAYMYPIPPFAFQSIIIICYIIVTDGTVCIFISHRALWGILQWPLSVRASVRPSRCLQLYLDNRLIDLIENLHSDSVYMLTDTGLIKCLTRSDMPDLQTFNRPHFIHILYYGELASTSCKLS